MTEGSGKCQGVISSAPSSSSRPHRGDSQPPASSTDPCSGIRGRTGARPNHVSSCRSRGISHSAQRCERVPGIRCRARRALPQRALPWWVLPRRVHLLHGAPCSGTLRTTPDHAHSFPRAPGPRQGRSILSPSHLRQPFALSASSDVTRPPASLEEATAKLLARSLLPFSWLGSKPLPTRHLK